MTTMTTMPLPVLVVTNPQQHAQGVADRAAMVAAWESFNPAADRENVVSAGLLRFAPTWTHECFADATSAVWWTSNRRADVLALGRTLVAGELLRAHRVDANAAIDRFVSDTVDAIRDLLTQYVETDDNMHRSAESLAQGAANHLDVLLAEALRETRAAPRQERATVLDAVLNAFRARVQEHYTALGF